MHPSSGYQPPQPAVPPPATNTLSNLTHQFKTLIAAQRPWPSLLSAAAISLPSSPSVAFLRLRQNTAYFRSNYALVVAVAVAASLVIHPQSLLLFAALAAAWYFLFFSRPSGPISILGRTVDDGLVLGILAVVTLVSFLVTNLAGNLFGGLVLGLGVVVVHAVVRGTDDLPVEQLPVVTPAAVSAVGGFVFPVQTQTNIR